MQACATARQPEAALQLFERLEASPIDADYVSYSTQSSTRRTGSPTALGSSGSSADNGFELWGRLPELDVHDLSEGAAETAVRWWLEEGVRDRVAAAPDEAPERLELITGWGK